jgi:Uma2 family endonuclease
MADAARKIDDIGGGDITVDEFIAVGRTPDGGKYELVNGELRAQSPASDAHGIIQANCAGLLFQHLRKLNGPCRVRTEPAIAVRVRSRHNRRIPDVGVSCTPNQSGALEMDDPVVLIEILSAGNKEATWDNVWAYTTIPTVKDILILSSFSLDGYLLSRDGDGNWPEDPTRLRAGDPVNLAAIEFICPLDEIYAGTYMAG